MTNSSRKWDWGMAEFVSTVFFVAVALPSFLMAADPLAAEVSFKQGDQNLSVLIGGLEVAEYVFRDNQILRPYFRRLRTLSGAQVTRNSPPTAADLSDHATMHPGLWLAFGDLSGGDFWRNKGQVKHEGFVKAPSGGAGLGSWVVKNSYQVEAKTICEEQCAIAISVRGGGYLIDWTSEFRSAESDFAFGDQEEMGLGVRVATPLAVANGGEIVDSAGRKNGKQVWGQQAEWCRYGGVIDDKRRDVVLMPDPSNFRRAWFHARDYGLLVANPFGQNAFTQGEKSKVVVPKGDSFRLRFGVLILEGSVESPPHVEAAYREFMQASTKPE